MLDTDTSLCVEEKRHRKVCMVELHAFLLCSTKVVTKLHRPHLNGMIGIPKN